MVIGPCCICGKVVKTACPRCHVDVGANIYVCSRTECQKLHDERERDAKLSLTAAQWGVLETIERARLIVDPRVVPPGDDVSAWASYWWARRLADERLQPLE